jgi:oligopeptidase B
MSKFHRCQLAFWIPVLVSILVVPAAAQDLLPPVARQEPTELSSNGRTRIDEYYWMRNRESQEVLDWLTGENKYLDAVMEPTRALQEKLAGELRERIPQTDASVPVADRGWLWYDRIEDGQQYERYFRRPVAHPDAPEEVVLDVNQIAEGHSFCSVGGPDVSQNGQLIAFPVDLVGRRKYTVHFRDLATGKDLADRISDVTGNMAWAEDNRTLFYTRQDPETLRSDRVYSHVLGTDPATDRLVYTEMDPEFSVGVGKSRSRDFIVIASSQTLSSEFRLINAHHPELEPVVFLAREENHEYSVDHFNGEFFVRTNWDAPNFRLMKAADPGRDKSTWTEVVPHSTTTFLEGVALLRDWLVVEQRENGLTRIRYRKWDARDFSTVDFGEPCYAASMAVTPETATDELRYVFSSLRTPDSVFEVNLKTGARKLLKQDRIGGGFDTESYVTERLWATAHDGVKVPVSVLRKKSTPVDGTAPCFLYAYGSYGASTDANFDASMFNFVDRGFVYAIAHVRGGQELGRQWYEDGKLLKKKNTFTDFIDCGRFLISQKYADPKRIYANGGSAGGLLMGAVANMAPELFHGIIAEVPFVDVITTMLDDTIPLTTSEYDEWGNPNDPVYYDYMLSYSPYDNVETRAYPHLLVTTGLHDSQVQYFEPAKWVARLRAKKTDSNLLLLHTDMEAGHGGSTGRYDQYAEIALRQAFILRLAGLDK